MAKIIKGELYRYQDGYACRLHLGGNNFRFCWESFCEICPGLAKGMRECQTREVILTQTKYAIKLKLSKKERP